MLDLSKYQVIDKNDEETYPLPGRRVMLIKQHRNQVLQGYAKRVGPHTFRWLIWHVEFDITRTEGEYAFRYEPPVQ